MVRLKVVFVEVKFIIDEPGNGGVVEIGQKAVENDVSLALPFVVYVSADRTLRRL